MRWNSQSYFRKGTKFTRKRYKEIHKTFLSHEFFINHCALNGGYKGTGTLQRTVCLMLLHVLTGHNCLLPEERYAGVAP